ncbi:MAG: hypothetical protein HOH60_00795 [Opitutae bacterium]|nr:hypothetical protein [Opitutae bacterium]
MNRSIKPIATVEKAWLARHQYDHERRMLIPMIGGTRWGAVQEYKEDGTLEYRDWWIRDVKIEDLEARPSTLLKRPEKTNSNKPITLENIDLDSFQGTLQAEAISTSEPDAIPTEFPLNQEDLNIENTELPVSESPFPALPFDSTPPFQEINSASDNPFAPLPDGLPPLDPISDGGNVPPPDPFGL